MLRSGGRAILVGTQLSGVISAGPRIVSPRPTPIIISTMSPECIGMELRGTNGSVSPASANYPSANVALFLPFSIADPILVLKLWVMNGAAVAGNIDLGLFKPDGTMIVGKGSTLQAGTNNVQELDITDTRLDPGTYYLGITSDTSGATQKVYSVALVNAGFGSAIGMLQASQAPALASVTFATSVQAFVPYIGLSARTLVA